ncbi:MAG: hypothetical protein WC565_04460 [Parcubacteria group bacterium]
MRTVVGGTTRGNMQIDFRVQDEAGAWQNLSARVYDVTYSDELESDSCGIRVALRNAYKRWVENTNNSLDPSDTSSSYYVSSAPLLGHYHECYLKVSKDSGANWYEIFRGRVGPGSVSCFVDISGDDVVEVSPVDESFRYKEQYWYDSLTYKDADAVSICSQMIRDQGFRGMNDSVVEIDAPAYHIEEYQTGQTNLWDAMKRLLEPTGYIFRMTWDPTSGAFRPCVYDPERDKSVADITFSGNFSSRRIDVNEQDVRTKVVVRYRDRNYGTVRPAQVEDETARDKYGIPNGTGGRLHKTMWYVAEGTGDRYSMIDTQAEAESLASYILHDLKEPSPNVEIEMRYIHPGIEVHDYVAFVGRDYTVNVGVTAVSWQWSVDNQVGTMNVTGTVDRVIGLSKTWLVNDTRNPDVANAALLTYLAGDGQRPETPTAPSVKSYWGTDSDTGAEVTVLEATTTPVKNWDLSQYRWRYRVEDEDWIEQTTDKPRLFVKGLPVGKPVKVQVRAEDWSAKGG